MKLLVDNTSEAFNQIKAVLKKVKETNEEINFFLKNLGAKEYSRNYGYMAGGISGVRFDEKPEGWKSVGDKHKKLYYPRANNKELLELFHALPEVQWKEFNDIVNFTAVFSHMGIEPIGDDQIVLTADHEWVLKSVGMEQKWSPPSFLKEITITEYQELKNSEPKTSNS